ncbi:MAG: hypothetical protein H0T48_12245 [Gemmatimonadaceae bacterium]|nr:hypothetical protein [Gemmatimonadaceae bacterium]
MTEPAVTLTDYAIAIECAVFALALLRLDARDTAIRSWFVAFFASISAASLLGGTVHGFFAEASSTGRLVLWPATLLSILATSLAAWTIGAILHLDERRATLVRRLAIAQLLIFALVVLFVTSKFYVAIIAYLPSTLFLLFTLLAAYRRRPDAGVKWGVTGLALTLAAAALQQLGVGIHPVYFDHNALYHVIQGVALWMIFLAARSISSARPPIRRSRDLTA